MAQKTLRTPVARNEALLKILKKPATPLREILKSLRPSNLKGCALVLNVSIVGGIGTAVPWEPEGLNC